MKSGRALVGWAGVLLATAFGGAALAGNVGAKIEDFSLGDPRGQEHSLADEPNAKAHVLVFLGTECPLVNLYAHRLMALANEYRARGVYFWGINSNSQDSLAEIAAHAERLGLTFPVLKDPGNVVADRLGAARTPEVVVLDADRRIRYQGRIDDQFGIGFQRPKPTENTLELAIEATLAGRDPAPAVTDVEGCRIGRAKRPNPSGDITYTNQIARILQRRCVECHHEGEVVAPFALTSYDETVGWAEMIREVVDARRMPPWHANPAHGSFSNDPTLTDEERAQLFTWIDNGCPKGDDKDLPKPIALAEGWTMSQPDDVFYMSEEPYQVPAEGSVNYQYYVVDPGNTEDKWIEEAEVRAGSPGVVHHVIVFIRRNDRGMGDPQMAYAPGMPPRKLPPGHAIKLPAGSKLIFQVHYTPNGVAQEDRSYVGFKYADPKDVTHEVIGGSAGVFAFVIPPNDPNYRMTAWEVMRQDTILIGMNPHMHLRGKAFRYELVYPDGRSEILLDVPHYDFNWQLWYNLKEPKLMPKGSKLVCTAHFDNSSENLSNPDPNRKVTWGEQTWDEMMFGFYSHVRPIDSTAAVEDDTRNGN